MSRIPTVCVGNAEFAPLTRERRFTRLREISCTSSCRLERPVPEITNYTVDGEPQETTQRERTPRAILESAGLDPTQRYLIKIDGNHQESFKDKMDTPIHIHEKEKFISAFNGPTPVS
jgi:hypothetical protein